MSKVFSRSEIQALDKKAIALGMPGVVLMENAGRAVAEYLISQKCEGKVTICCGKGNNAGDGFVVARYLDNHQIPVSVLCFAPPEKEDAKIHYHILTQSEISIVDCYSNNKNAVFDLKALVDSQWIIDALFGTGLTGPIKPPYDAVVKAINESNAKVLAIDVPSGLDCDTGQPLGPTVRATHTVTFVGQKKGFLKPEAQAWLGQVKVADIGIPRILMK